MKKYTHTGNVLWLPNLHIHYNILFIALLLNDWNLNVLPEKDQ